MTHHGHDYDATKWGWFARGVLRIAEVVGVSFAHQVICVSDSIRADVAPLSNRSRTIRNGVTRNPDVSKRPRNAALTKLVPRTYVLVVGRITAHKRILDVVAAMGCAELQGLKLVVCGSLQSDDVYVEAVKAAARRGSDIVLAGFVEPSELPWLYRHSLCTVMPSSYEGMPLAVLEALAAGSTVFLSDIPAHREIELPSARYFPVGDVMNLREKLARLRATPLEQRTADAATLDLRFDWSMLAEQSASVFEEVTRGRATAIGCRRQPDRHS
jgi:glycosyltransferase involved in cell wall biosynthesis